MEQTNRCSATQTLQIDVHPVAEVSLFPQTQPDTFRAFFKKNIFTPPPPLSKHSMPPQIIDLLPGDYTHCHKGINKRHPGSSDTHCLQAHVCNITLKAFFRSFFQFVFFTFFCIRIFLFFRHRYNVSQQASDWFILQPRAFRLPLN